jgi:hypothetical protein
MTMDFGCDRLCAPLFDSSRFSLNAPACFKLSVPATAALLWPAAVPRILLPPFAHHMRRLMSNPTRVVSVLQVNFAHWQPFYTIFKPWGLVYKAFSTGALLSLAGQAGKHSRRSPASILTAVSIFKRFFPKRGSWQLRLFICRAFKKRYDPYLQSALVPFALRHFDALVFNTRQLMHTYKWRRVAPIKRRIRKRLGIRSSK